MKNLVGLVSDLEAGGVGFCSLTDQIDTITPSGRFFFHVMASLAQMERELIAERTTAGLQAARAQGGDRHKPWEVTGGSAVIMPMRCLPWRRQRAGPV